MDHARSRKYAKRGGGSNRISFKKALVVSKERGADLVALDEALDKLAAIDARKSKVVELRFFGGLSVEETSALHTSAVAGTVNGAGKGLAVQSLSKET